MKFYFQIFKDLVSIIVKIFRIFILTVMNITQYVLGIQKHEYLFRSCGVSASNIIDVSAKLRSSLKNQIYI